MEQGPSKLGKLKLPEESWYWWGVVGAWVVAIVAYLVFTSQQDPATLPSICKVCMCLSIGTDQKYDIVAGLLLKHLQKWFPEATADDIELTSQQADGPLTTYLVKIFCKGPEMCSKLPDYCNAIGEDDLLRNVLSDIFSYEGINVDLLEFVGSGCIDDLKDSNGDAPAYCDYQDVVAPSPNICHTPPALRHPDPNGPYGPEAALVDVGDGVIALTMPGSGNFIYNRQGANLQECGDAGSNCESNPKCERQPDGSCAAADFNIAVTCSHSATSTEAQKTDGGVYYIRAACPSISPQENSPYYKYARGAVQYGAGGECTLPCRSPDLPDGVEFATGSGGDPIQNLNFAEFNVQYQCKQGYSAAEGTSGPPYPAIICAQPGLEFSMDVECVPDCMRPDNYDNYAGVSALTLPAIPRFEFSSYFTDLTCAPDYAEGTTGAVAAHICGSAQNYTLTGCNERCEPPPNWELYDTPAEPTRPSKDNFVWGQQGTVSCKAATAIEFDGHPQTGQSIGPTAHNCLQYGGSYGLTGCYPTCDSGADEGEDAECLNMKIEYPPGAAVSEETIYAGIAQKLSQQNPGADINIEDYISYYNEVTNVDGEKIIEFQIKCPYANCEILKDPALEGWYDSQQMAVQGVRECQEQVGEQREQCISAAMEAARNQYETLCDEDGVDRFDLSGLQVSSARTPRERHDDIINQIHGLLDSQPSPQAPCVCAPGYEPRTQQNIEDELRFSRADAAANKLWPAGHVYTTRGLGALTRWRQDAILRAQAENPDLRWLDADEADILSAIKDGIEGEWKVKCLPS